MLTSMGFEVAFKLYDYFLHHDAIHSEGLDEEVIPD